MTLTYYIYTYKQRATVYIVLEQSLVNNSKNSVFVYKGLPESIVFLFIQLQGPLNQDISDRKHEVCYVPVLVLLNLVDFC